MVFFFLCKYIIFYVEVWFEYFNIFIFKVWKGEEMLVEEIYYLLGGGFIEQVGVNVMEILQVQLFFLIDKGKDLLCYIDQQDVRIFDVVWVNELWFWGYNQVKDCIGDIFQVMLECVY